MIPRMLFRQRNVVLGNVGNAATGALLFGVFFILTLYLQQVRGYSPLDAALWTIPISVAVFLGSQITFRLFGRISPVSALAGGFVVQALALIWWALGFGAHSNVLVSFVLPGMLWGIGVGAAIVAAFVVCTSGLPGAVQGAGSGLVSMSLQIGGAVGVAVLSTIAARRTNSLMLNHSAGVADAMASGQEYALWGAVVVAIIGVPIMAWLRASWRPSAHHGEQPTKAA